jgi:uncharacterized membrane protein YagU involved in acid resistance
MRINWSKAVLAGVVGTLVMTAVGVWVAPMMGIPRMNPAEMLAQPMGGSLMMGWVGHLMIGVVLSVLFAAVVGRLSGPAWARGATFAIAPYLMAQLIVMPMMGMPIFSGSVALAMGSLIGHLIYGATVGAIYGSAVTTSAGHVGAASLSSR